MIAIVDYGVGNLFSLRGSMEAVGANVVVTADPKVLHEATHILLPGVGAFEDAAKKLESTGLVPVLREETASGKPLLGICLGMQMLHEKSYEYGEHKGLGLIRGTVKPISDVIPKDYKIPHIGWNALHLCGESPLFRYVKEGDCVYFVHSYYADCAKESLIATTEYGGTLTAAVSDGNVYGTQFHPEKSGTVGLKILKAFMEIRS